MQKRRQRRLTDAQFFALCDAFGVPRKKSPENFFRPKMLVPSPAAGLDDSPVSGFGAEMLAAELVTPDA